MAVPPFLSFQDNPQYVSTIYDITTLLSCHEEMRQSLLVPVSFEVHHCSGSSKFWYLHLFASEHPSSSKKSHHKDPGDTKALPCISQQMTYTVGFKDLSSLTSHGGEL